MLRQKTEKTTSEKAKSDKAKSDSSKFDAYEKAKETLKLCIGGLQQGATYCGVEQHLVGSMRVQHGGTRLVATVRPSDVSWLKTFDRF